MMHDPGLCECGDHGFIPLQRAKVALVDAGDFEALAHQNWRAIRGKRTFYAGRDARPRRMHRVIIGAKMGEIVDHRDGDGLNNRKSNLRFCTSTQNAWNMRPPRSKRVPFKGVFENRPGSFRASITAHGRRRYLGCFKCPVEAAQAYDAAATEAHGEFALTNEALGMILPSGQEAAE